MSQKMTLHWSPKSPYVRKVMICLHELNLENRVEKIRSVAAMLKPNPSIMQDNPLSKIPTMTTEDGTVLYDSVVICEYLNTLGRGDIFPEIAPEKWQALRWHALGNGLLDALILWRNEREKEHPLTELISAFEIKFNTCLNLLDDEIQALTSSRLNIGTITLGCALGYVDYRFENLNWKAKHPELASWFRQISQRPSFIASLPVDG